MLGFWESERKKFRVKIKVLCSDKNNSSNNFLWGYIYMKRKECTFSNKKLLVISLYLQNWGRTVFGRRKNMLGFWESERKNFRVKIKVLCSDKNNSSNTDFLWGYIYMKKKECTFSNKKLLVISLYLQNWGRTVFLKEEKHMFGFWESERKNSGSK